jgi:glycosyltransferase involved in cell wall biosynthesis
MKEAAKDKSLHFSFVVLDTKEPELMEEVKQYGFDCYWIKFDAGKRRKSMVYATRKLYSLFRKIKPDIVHSHLFDDSVPALFAARLARVPKRVITKQDTAFHFNYAKRWVRFDRFNNRNATHVVPVSKEAYEFVREIEKCSEKKMHLVHHGIDRDQFLSFDNAEREKIRANYAPNGEVLIGTLARFIHWKRYDLALDVAEIVVKETPQAKFVFWGNGDLKADIAEEIKNRGLGKNVILADYYPRDKIENVYAAMDIYLHTAYMEPFGFVLAEAMMCGVPVVSTPTGAARDAIIHTENGWIGQYDNAESLAKGILFYLNNPIVKPLVPARDIALKMYSFPLMFSSYLNLYKS